MAATDISAPVARMKTLISAITDIGLVWEYDPFSRTDLRPFVVSSIGGQDVMRAWWISGPTMVGRPMVQTSGGWLERTWRYSIYGIEGLSDTGDSTVTLRANTQSVIDALDVERDLNAVCHRTQPCQIVVGPENRSLWLGIACSFVQITKEIVTLSTP